MPVPCHEKRHEGQGGVARLHRGSPKNGGKPKKNVVFNGENDDEPIKKPLDFRDQLLSDKA